MYNETYQHSEGNELKAPAAAPSTDLFETIIAEIRAMYHDLPTSDFMEIMNSMFSVMNDAAELTTLKAA